MTRVVVLAGGVGGEREVSLAGARAVAEALRRGGHEVEHIEIGELSRGEADRLPEGVIFPVLHGEWGEGGVLQGLLEDAGRVFVGSVSGPAGVAMDKVRTLEVARSIGIPTAGSVCVDSIPAQSPIALPVVIKPRRDGSSVGLRICRSREEWNEAREAVAREASARRAKSANGPAWIIERFVRGRELTVGLLDGEALPIIEIVPPEGAYDYQAKYVRDDTRYVVDPDIPEGVCERLKDWTRSIAREIGIRHLARADYLLEQGAGPVFLEINTMPGFTDHSLLPLAARAIGLELSDVVSRLVQCALRDAGAAVVGGG